MAIKFLSTQRVVNLSSDPASGTIGEIYFNTSDSELKVYDGASWSSLGGSSGGGAGINVDGGVPNTNYGGIDPIDGGSVV
jgi:hypothetical protein